MGVNGLWEVVQYASQRRTLTDLAVEEGVTSTKGLCGFRVGVDASIWFYSCQQPFMYMHARRGENPELRTIFHKLARLSSLPINAVFIFDGPQCPAEKRNKKVVQGTHFLTNGLRNLAEAFGFTTLTAPGEAEAQLAHMNKVGLIDAVLTDDSDALVFGARTVIRNSSLKDDGDEVAVYTQAAICSREDASLSPAGLFLIAVLSGGNYSIGLWGCGAHIARRLARYDIGDNLYTAALALDGTALVQFLHIWRMNLCHLLQDDPAGFLGRRYPTLASSVPLDFPDIEVLIAYAKPVTLLHPHEQSYSFYKSLPWPDISKLAQLCEQYFTWGMAAGIVSMFKGYVFPACVMRQIIHETIFGLDVDESERECTYDARGPVKDKATSRPRRWVLFPGRPYIQQVFSSLRHLPGRADDHHSVEMNITYRTKVISSLFSHHYLPSALSSPSSPSADPSHAESVGPVDTTELSHLQSLALSSPSPGPLQASSSQRRCEASRLVVIDLITPPPCPTPDPIDLTGSTCSMSRSSAEVVSILEPVTNVHSVCSNSPA